MKEVFGAERKIALCREITKLNEEIIRTNLEGAVALYTDKDPRGEYVLVIEGAAEAGCVTDTKADALLLLSPKEHVEHYISLGLSKMDAIKATAKDRGVAKNDIYKEVIN